MSRCFISPQAGRYGRNGSVVHEDEPWGTTSSRSQFRAFDPAAAQSSRGTPTQVMELVQNKGPAAFSASVRSTRQPWSTTSNDAAESAVTASSKSTLRACRAERPEWTKADLRPIPERPFLGNSHYREHEEAAQKARHNYFPYRDEFAPRSKRLLYEMALAKCVEDDDKSTVAGSQAGSASCFTAASKARSKASRSASTPALPAVPGTPPPPTGDSLRLGDSLCAVARRRRDAFLKSPSMSHHDAAWYREMLQKEGPAGLCTLNYPSYCHSGSLAGHAEMVSSSHALFGYREENGMGNPVGKLK